MSKVDLLTLPADGVTRFYSFADVVATWRNDAGRCGEVSIPGICSSEYSSGPSLFMLADAVQELLGDYGGRVWVGLKSCRRV